MNVTPAYYLCSTGFRNCRVKFYNVYGVPALDKRNYHSIHSHDTLVFWMNLHTNTFCKYRKTTRIASRAFCVIYNITLKVSTNVSYMSVLCGNNFGTRFQEIYRAD